MLSPHQRCPPCKTAAPVFAQMSLEYDDKQALFVKVKVRRKLKNDNVSNALATLSSSIRHLLRPSLPPPSPSLPSTTTLLFFFVDPFFFLCVFLSLSLSLWHYFSILNFSAGGWIWQSSRVRKDWNVWRHSAVLVHQTRHCA